MLNSYRDVLALPGARAFSSSAFVSRLPLSMAGIGIVLLVSDQTGAYGLAGTITAAYVLASAASAPIQGRLSDVHGQAIVLRTAGLLFGIGMTLTILSVKADWAVPLPHLCAALAGIGAPQAGSMVRARWSHLLSEPRQLNTAYALEAVVDELVFMVGPVIITLVATTISPVLGLVITAVAAFIGTFSLARQHRTEPPRVRHDEGARPPLGWGLLGPVMLASVGLGLLFGSTEIVVVAFASEADQRGLAGVILAIWAAGSLVAGLLIGSLRVPLAPLRQLRISASLLAVAFVPLAYLDSVVFLSLGMFVAGFMISPSLIGAMSLIGEHVPPSRLTEGIAWTTTGLAAGVAPGAALAGWAVDHHGASAAFLVPLAAGAFTALVAWSIRPPIRPHHGDPAALR
ncbi:MFS transporter [soil metagenome]